MERVIERMDGKVIIGLFIVIVLASTIYMGLSERKLSSVSLENSKTVATNM